MSDDAIQLGTAASISFLAAGISGPQSLVFKAVIIKVERAAVFADGAHGGIVKALCALAVDLNRDFHVVAIRFQPLDDFVSNLAELKHGTLRFDPFCAVVTCFELWRGWRVCCGECGLRARRRAAHRHFGRFVPPLRGALGIQLCFCAISGFTIRALSSK